MKRSFLLSLVFAFACCLFANQSAQAQYVEGVSILAEEPLYDLVISYSATESDYYTTFYYDAYVTAGLHVNGIQVAYNTDQDSGGDGVAEVSFGVITHGSEEERK